MDDNAVDSCTPGWGPDLKRGEVRPGRSGDITEAPILGDVCGDICGGMWSGSKDCLPRRLSRDFSLLRRAAIDPTSKSAAEISKESLPVGEKNGEFFSGTGRFCGVPKWSDIAPGVSGLFVRGPSVAIEGD